MKKLGFGFMRLPLLAEDTTQIDMPQTQQMVDLFLECGFCYFDTAYRYHEGVSETALKAALVERHPRESFLLANKMPSYMVETPEDYPRIFSDQLEKCGVAFFDYYLMHALNDERYELMKALGGFAFMQQRKEAGEITRIGFSFHDTAVVLDKILTEQPGMEFVQLQINYLDWDDAEIQSAECYDVARRHGVDIIIMEPVKGGALANLPPSSNAMLTAADPTASPASWAVRYAASLPGVIMVLSGMSTLDQVADNTGYMQEFAPLTDAEFSLLADAAKDIRSNTAVPCTACAYCVETCPQSIPIPKIFEVYNRYSRFHMPMEQDNYNYVTKDAGKAGDCIACGVCEGLCPQHIHIIDALQEASAAFDKT